jgi:cell division protein FtsL
LTVAVYEGARPRTIALPRRPRLAETPAPALPRRRARSAVRARRGPNRLALVLGGIVVAFMLAFFSLAQQVQVSATTYDIGRLQIQKERLESQLQELRSDLNRLGREPAVRKLALDGGLGQLAEPIVLPAR